MAGSEPLPALPSLAFAPLTEPSAARPPASQPPPPPPATPQTFRHLSPPPRGRGSPKHGPPRRSPLPVPCDSRGRAPLGWGAGWRARAEVRRHRAPLLPGLGGSTPGPPPRSTAGATLGFCCCPRPLHGRAGACPVCPERHPPRPGRGSRLQRFREVGRTYRFHMSEMKERYKEEGVCLFSVVLSDKTRGNRHKLKLSRTPLNFSTFYCEDDSKKNFLRKVVYNQL
ncbi:uncharacterized protein LOC135301203 [Passer domesticus]|uniref:uncharacterized protein LOC135301203 n=1 Tax=Passer domesticus TaxID=48849 RepID=UPI0030FEBCBB